MNGLKYAVIMMLLVFTSVLAAWSEAPALSFSFQINRFQVNQGGVNLVNDSFDDGREPPIGRPSDDDACAATNSCRYRTPTIGTFGANDETGGSLTLNDIGGDIGTSSSGVRRVRKGAQLRRPIRQIPVGSEVAEGFFVEADFAGTLPRDTLAEFGLRESYRIQLIDSGTGGTFDDSVILEVANAGGVPRIRFRDVSGGETLGDLFPGPLSSEITLRLNVDSSGNVTASFDANGSAGGFNFIDILDDNGVVATTTIYNGEDFTRARFLAQSPIPEPSTLLLLGFGLVGLGLFRRRRKAA